MNKITTDREKAEAHASAFFAARDRDDPPLEEIIIRPSNLLPAEGFVILIAFVCCAFLIPIFAFLGSLVLWGVLLPILITIAALWTAMRRNYKDRSVHEILSIWPDLVTVERVNPRGSNQYWHANPYWVTSHMKDTKTIENYLTLKGGGREIELGAFLAAEERPALRVKVDDALRNCGSRG